MSIFNIFKTKKSNELEIGKSISWKNSINIIFKIIDFDSNGTTVDEFGNVNAKSISKPYGYLTVSNPAFLEKLKLPITHKDDFLLADGILNNSNFLGIEKTKDFLVTYRPKNETSDGLAGIHHALHFSITPNESLNNYYNKYGNDKNLEVLENIFVIFSWYELRVQINSEPKI